MRFRRGSLTTRVLLVLALATITPTLVVGFLAIRRARHDVEREVVRGNLALIRALGAQLDATLQNARRTLELGASAWADPRPASDTIGDSGATERLLRRLRREVPLFQTISVLDVDGKRLHGDAIARDVGTGAHTFGGYIGDATLQDGRLLIPVIAQARSRTGELVGVFVAQLDLQFVSQALASARLGRGARLMVVDGEGIAVARSDSPMNGFGGTLRRTNPAVDRALSSTVEGSLEYAGLIAVYRNLAGYQSLRGVRWAILLEQPTREAYALAYATTTDTIVAGLGVLALALLIGFVLAARLTRPLHQLAEHADAIAGEGGDAPPPAPMDAPGEIGHLAHRIDEMAKRIGEREKLQSALARGDRLATVGTMAASVAHEINNPLTTILGYAKLLAEDKPDDHPDRTGLELIADEAARMKTIVGSMLDYSRAERPRADAADVGEVTRRVATLLTPQLARARVALELELATHLPRVTADSHSLQQVLVNLVQNAAHATPQGGTITIASRLAPGQIAVEVMVLDDGDGVPASDRTRVFEPFYTTKERGKGTGLGLAVARHLVTGAGGSLEVGDGPPGRGAAFRLVLPLAE